MASFPTCWPNSLRLAQAVEAIPRRDRHGDGNVRGVGLIRERHLAPRVGRGGVGEGEGLFEHDVRVAKDPITKWVARKAAAGQTVTMWMVARDNRGGMTWATRQIRVKK